MKMGRKGLNDFRQIPASSTFETNQSPSSGNRNPKMKQRERQEQRGGSARAPRQSGNHLLNFKHYSPASPSRRDDIFHRSRKIPTIGISNREEYLQANFQFILLPGTDLSLACFTSSDTLVDWKFVESVRIPLKLQAEYQIILDSELVEHEERAGWKCPICLERPKCPRVTRCGHGPFCLVCVLRHLDNEFARRCPMCFDHISRDRLACALLNSNIYPVVGQSATFVLLSRSKKELVPHRASSKGLGDIPSLPCPLEDDAMAKFSRLVISNPRFLVERMMNETWELESFRKHAIGSGDVEWLPFISEAIDMISMRRMKLQASGHLSSDFTDILDSAGRAKHVGAKRGKTNEMDFSAEKVNVENQTNYQFYQMEDGQYAFLHPINMRCLLEEHSLEGKPPLPSNIVGTILEVEIFRLSAELRRRYAFLGHLPEHCDITFVELDLSRNLSQETLSKFEHDLERRKQRRDSIELQRMKELEEEEIQLKAKSDLLLAMRFATVDLDGPLPGSNLGSDDLPDSNIYVSLEQEMISQSTEQVASFKTLSGLTDSFAKVLGKVPEKVEDFPVLGATTVENHLETSVWGIQSHSSHTLERKISSKVDDNTLAVKTKSGRKGKAPLLFSNTSARRGLGR